MHIILMKLLSNARIDDYHISFNKQRTKIFEIVALIWIDDCQDNFV